jgi:hypothetical protein
MPGCRTRWPSASNMGSSMRQPMRSVLMSLIAVALGLSSAFLVACGDRNDLIPRSDAAAINADLDRAASLYRREECRAAQAAIVDAQSRAIELPDRVDADLRRTLRENIDHSLQRVRAECGRTQTTQPTQTTQTTATTPTRTTQTTTETEPTTTTEPEPPPTTDGDQDGGENGGGGRDGGSGGTPPGGGSGGSRGPG